MIKKVELLDGKPLEVASHAALRCYQSEDPKIGQIIDVEGRLFIPSHHTTLQHAKSFFTFSIEGISVGDIIFGLHMVHPFYNSDERSGRYCATMFLEPDFYGMEKYIKGYWPNIKKKELKDVLDYIRMGVDLYQKNISVATEVAKKLIKKERPFVSEKYLEANAPKIAQEQLRMFISVIFPTGLDFTVNLTVLAALHRTAWTPAMQHVVSEMVRIVLEKHPELGFMFNPDKKNLNEWSMELPKEEDVNVAKQPNHRLLALSGENNFILPDSADTHPIDLLHFRPKYMDNSIGEIRTRISISAATMHQDQRHRTIRRGEPSFTGKFYLPPILSEIGLDQEAKKYLTEWIRIGKNVPGTLAMILAPYGAMVSYDKAGSFNAVVHEQGKRLCWCAQEEIYHAGLFLRQAIEKECGKQSKLLQIFEPPCYRTGKCAEGGRYCGRDIKLRKNGDYFVKRKI
ncbi:MAG: Thymidylate synthase [uncultured bacterium]|nr:MAG: Thymidylate synthase [uncultured bacterium]